MKIRKTKKRITELLKGGIIHEKISLYDSQNQTSSAGYVRQFRIRPRDIITLTEFGMYLARRNPSAIGSYTTREDVLLVAKDLGIDDIKKFYQELKTVQESEVPFGFRLRASQFRSDTKGLSHGTIPSYRPREGRGLTNIRESQLPY